MAEANPDTEFDTEESMNEATERVRRGMRRVVDEMGQGNAAVVGYRAVFTMFLASTRGERPDMFEANSNRDWVRPDADRVTCRVARRACVRDLRGDCRHATGEPIYTHKLILLVMRVITVRLDEETEKAMQRVRGVNWSVVVRQRIREVAKRHSRQNKVKALLAAQGLSRKPAKGFDSTKVIRTWRDRRHGALRSGR